LKLGGLWGGTMVLRTDEKIAISLGSPASSIPGKGVTLIGRRSNK